MNAIGACIIARNKGAGWKPESGHPDNDPASGLGRRGPVGAPGLPPALSSYPYPNAIR